MNIITSSNNIINLYTDDDIFSWYSKFSRNRIIRDRFGLNINQFSPWMVSNNKDCIPIGNISDSVVEILHKEIECIYKQGKNIYILWSGGVDSTSIICSFIQQNYTSNIKILYSDNSIKEFPAFFEYLKNNTSWELIYFNYLNFYDLLQTISSNDRNVIVSGLHGDKLYEGSIPSSHIQDGYLHWKEFVIKYNGRNFIPIFEYIFSKFDIQPSTALDFFWMLDLNFRWGETLSFPYIKRLMLPFTSNLMQELCVKRMKLYKSYGCEEYNNPKLYKPELKSIIYDVIHNNEYLYKEKVHSFREMTDYDKTRYVYYTYLWCDSGVIIHNTLDEYEKKKFLRVYRKESYI